MLGPGHCAGCLVIKGVSTIVHETSPGHNSGIEFLAEHRLDGVAPQANSGMWQESDRSEVQSYPGARVHALAGRMGGSDGDRLREIDVEEPSLIPFLYPERLLCSKRRSGVERYATVIKGPRIARERWLEIAARVPRERLRAVARDFGVSHETVQGIVRRVEQRDPLCLPTRRDCHPG